MDENITNEVMVEETMETTGEAYACDGCGSEDGSIVGTLVKAGLAFATGYVVAKVKPVKRVKKAFGKAKEKIAAKKAEKATPVEVVEVPASDEE